MDAAQRAAPWAPLIDGVLRQRYGSLDHPAAHAVRGAGELIPGDLAVGACAARWANEAAEAEVNVLRRQVIALAEGAWGGRDSWQP